MKSKLIKLLSLGIISFGLVGCNPAGGSTGRIDCYSISLSSSTNTMKYSLKTNVVYEYTSSEGDSIYTNYYRSNIYYDQTTNQEVSYYLGILYHSNRFSADYVFYEFSGLVGYVYEENNYYLNLDSKTVDSETRYSKYTGLATETTFRSESITLDHNKAFSGASKGYLTTNNNTRRVNEKDANSPYAFLVYKEMNDAKLERHTYTIYGEDTNITYVPKWF